MTTHTTRRALMAGAAALDIVYGPNGKATSRKKAERRIREQNKRLFQRVMAVQS